MTRITARRPGSAAVAVRLLVAALLASWLLVGVGSPAGPAAVRAATPSLTLVTAATYDVQPDAGKVAVSVGITATNHLHDTVTKQYVFRFAYLAVLPKTSGFHLTTATGSPSVAVARRTSTYTLLKLDLGSNLRSGATRALTLTFDLKDPGGAPDRPIRISPSLVSFYAWAYATPSTPGSSVTLDFPAGYNVTIGRGPLSGPTTGTGGKLEWTSGPLDDPLAFVADITADHPSDYVDSPRTVTVGGIEASLILRAWPDDPAWRDRVGDLVVEGLPVLGDAIGLPWPMQDPLVVQEALVRTTGGYAGLFDPGASRVEIAYAAPPGVILHEAAHAWFNGNLVADRWAAEAFASYYAEVVGAELDVPVASPELDATKRAAAIPLNDWGAVGTEAPATESYAYAASLALARAIGARAGLDGLKATWTLAEAHVGAYQPAKGDREIVGTAPDWRALLDLLEDATGQSYVDLWRTWVVRPDDLPALDARSGARSAYAQAVADAGDWLLPASVRGAMRSWEFGTATGLLEAVEGVLRQRAALEHEAAGASLRLPGTLRQDFETGDLVGAASEASAELATIGTIEDATSRRLSHPTFLESLGLLGADPEAGVRAARDALADGDLAAANRDASAARSAWSSAASVGQARVVSGVLLLASCVLGAGLALSLLRRIRPRPPTEGRPTEG